PQLSRCPIFNTDRTTQAGTTPGPCPTTYTDPTGLAFLEKGGGIEGTGRQTVAYSTPKNRTFKGTTTPKPTPKKTSAATGVKNAVTDFGRGIAGAVKGVASHIGGGYSEAGQAIGDAWNGNWGNAFGHVKRLGGIFVDGYTMSYPRPRRCSGLRGSVRVENRTRGE
ncbi:hypothetical protein, partial [Micromonospora sp. LOL_023]|uniref:hypothetical protein n=1 Tax=Micromonospora sp. LOL_023 TaxID=3345418 RepID=UPI003A867AF2